MSEIPATSELPQRLGLRAAARALGISHPALLKAVETRRVQRESDGSFDIAKCRTMLAQNTHPVKSRSARAQQHLETRPEEALRTSTNSAAPDRALNDLPADLLDGVGAFEGQAPAVSPLESISEATRQLEWARVRREQLRVAREEGTLVELAPVNAFVAGMIMKAREEFGRLPEELCDSLANENDPVKVRSLLRVKIDEVLVKMSQYRRAA